MNPCVFYLPALALGTAALLAACGGGGGGSPSAPVPTPEPTPIAIDAAQLQGRWITTAGLTPAYSALVLPAQSGSAQAWLLAQDASSVSRLTLAGGQTLGISGKLYSLTGQAPVQAVSGAASAELGASPRTLTLTNLAPNAITLSQSDTLAGPANQADVAGAWNASLGQGGQFVNWSVAASGALTGTSNTGCVWSGAITAMGDVRLYSARFAENCAGAVAEFTGIGSVSADRLRFTVVGSLGDESRAVALLFGR